MDKRVGVVGLGIMGGAFARHLIAAGYQVLGCDVSAAAVRGFEQAGGLVCQNARDVAEGCDVCVLSLPSTDALAAVTGGGNGLSAARNRALVVIETSTLPIAAKIEAAALLRQAGHTLLDCPVSGTGAQAQRRDIVVFCSGDEASLRTVEPVIAAFARKIVHVGEFGNGSKLKLLANLLVTIHNVAAAEAIALGRRAGLDADLVFDVLKDSAGMSRMLEVRGPQMVARRFDEPTFTIANHLKDLGIIDEFRRSMDAEVPVFAAAARYYGAVKELGGAGLDTASVYLIAERLAGLVSEAGEGSDGGGEGEGGGGSVA